MEPVLLTLTHLLPLSDILPASFLRFCEIYDENIRQFLKSKYDELSQREVGDGNSQTLLYLVQELSKEDSVDLNALKPHYEKKIGNPDNQIDFYNWFVRSMLASLCKNPYDKEIVIEQINDYMKEYGRIEDEMHTHIVSLILDNMEMYNIVKQEIDVFYSSQNNYVNIVDGEVYIDDSSKQLEWQQLYMLLKEVYKQKHE